MNKNVILTITLFCTLFFVNSGSAQLFKSIQGKGTGTDCQTFTEFEVAFFPSYFILQNSPNTICPSIINIPCNNIYVGIEIDGDFFFKSLTGCDVNNGFVNIPLTAKNYCGEIDVTANLYCYQNRQYEVIEPTLSLTETAKFCCKEEVDDVIVIPGGLRPRNSTSVNISVNNQRNEIYIDGYPNIVTYSIYTVDGMLVKSKKLTNRTNSSRVVSTLELETGTYIIQTHSQQNYKSELFIKI